MSDVSVVIVSWNTKDLLVGCIQRIIAQTLAHQIEIIVVDNGSTDGSVEAVQRTFPDVKVIAQKTNTGFAKANNVGIRASSGNYVCLVNSDIEVLDGCIGSMCEYMDEHPEVALLGPRILNKDLSLQPTCRELPTIRNLLTQALMLDKFFPSVRFFRNRFMEDFDHSTIRDVETLSGCFLMTRPEAIEKVGLLDERYFIYEEDVDWCKSFLQSGCCVRFYPGAQAIHHGGASSAAAPARFLVEMQRANLEYWRKHHTWLVQKAAAFISFVHYWLRICLWAGLYIFRPESRNTARLKITNYGACISYLCGLRRC